MSEMKTKNAVKDSKMISTYGIDVYEIIVWNMKG